MTHSSLLNEIPIDRQRVLLDQLVNPVFGLERECLGIWSLRSDDGGASPRNGSIANLQIDGQVVLACRRENDLRLNVAFTRGTGLAHALAFEDNVWIGQRQCVILRLLLKR